MKIKRVSTTILVLITFHLSRQHIPTKWPDEHFILELSRPASLQQCSDEDIPPVPILIMINGEMVVVGNARVEDGDHALKVVVANPVT